MEKRGQAIDRNDSSDALVSVEPILRYSLSGYIKTDVK